MRLLNVSCTEEETDNCHTAIMLRYPGVLGVSHVQGKHLLIFAEDTDQEKNKEILHQIGGMVRTINKIERVKTNHVLPRIE